MVLAKAVEARSQRIILKRQHVIQESDEQAREIKKEKVDTDSPEVEFKEDAIIPEKTAKVETLQDEDEEPNAEDTKKNEEEKLVFKLPQGREIVSNIFRFLKEEYKYLQILNGDNFDLDPLGDIRLRTALATGLTKRQVGKIVKEERKKVAKNRKKRNHEGQ